MKTEEQIKRQAKTILKWINEGRYDFIAPCNYIAPYEHGTSLLPDGACIKCHLALDELDRDMQALTLEGIEGTVAQLFNAYGPRNDFFQFGALVQMMIHVVNARPGRSRLKSEFPTIVGERGTLIYKFTHAENENKDYDRKPKFVKIK